MNVTLTLVMYWSIAVALAVGGLYALNRGFALLVSSRGRSPEENTIEAFGLKAKMGSIGSLVMVTAFLWGWAAAHALPSYKDKDVTITVLRQQLAQKTRTVENLQTSLSTTNTQLAAFKRELGEKTSLLDSAKRELRETTSQLAAAKMDLSQKTAQLDAVRTDFARTTAEQKEQLTQVEQRLERLQRQFAETATRSNADLRVEHKLLDESLMGVRTTIRKLER